jgi:hypothetical protein
MSHFKFARERQESRRLIGGLSLIVPHKLVGISGLLSKGTINNLFVKIPDLFTYKHYNYKMQVGFS